jgi:hypothetical protein
VGDNAANNNTFLKVIENKCDENYIDFNYKKNYVRCIAHIINLAVQEILKYLKADVIHDENDILNNNYIETIPKVSTYYNYFIIIFINII